jgi:hypothetical protein
MINEAMCKVFFDMKSWTNMESIGECELGLLFKGQDEHGDLIIVACNDEKKIPYDDDCLPVFEKVAVDCPFDTSDMKIKTVEFKVISFLKLTNNDRQYLIRVKNMGQ